MVKYWYNDIGIWKYQLRSEDTTTKVHAWSLFRRKKTSSKHLQMPNQRTRLWGNGMVQNSKFPTDSVQHAWHSKMNTFYMLFPTKLLLNGFQSLVTIVVQVINFIANTAAPALATHHVEARFSWNTPAWSACQILLIFVHIV